MQKVEGSSPFIRSPEPAGNGGFSVGLEVCSIPGGPVAAPREAARLVSGACLSGVERVPARFAWILEEDRRVAFPVPDREWINVSFVMSDSAEQGGTNVVR